MELRDMESLNRRMMYFCDLAYSRSKVADKTRGQWTARDLAVGLVGMPQRVERHMLVDKKTGVIFPRDVAVVGRTDDAIVVAFRGTQPPAKTASRAETRSIIKDWLNDANVFGRDDHDHFEGTVHDGFSDAAVDLLLGADGVLARIDALRGVAGAPQRVVFTGHSKGGALAIFAAYWLVRHRAFLPADLSVFTFGGARCGNMAFGNAFATLQIGVTRYESDTDIVPLLPAGADVPEIVTRAARLLGYNRADGASGFIPCGTRSPARGLNAGKWLTAYLPLITTFAIQPKLLLEKLVWSHSIGAGDAYDAIVG